MYLAPVILCGLKYVLIGDKHLRNHWTNFYIPNTFSPNCWGIDLDSCRLSHELRGAILNRVMSRVTEPLQSSVAGHPNLCIYFHLSLPCTAACQQHSPSHTNLIQAACTSSTSKAASFTFSFAVLTSSTETTSTCPGETVPLLLLLVVKVGIFRFRVFSVHSGLLCCKLDENSWSMDLA